MDPRTKRRLWWALAALGAGLLVIVGILVSFAVQLTGGWDEVLDRTHPRPGDPEVVAVREVAAAEVDTEVVRVIDEIVTPTLTGGRVEVAPEVGAAMAPLPNADVQRDAQGSACVVGQHNWKIDDGFDLACAEIRAGVVAARQQTFVDDMLALDAALTADGYTPAGAGNGLALPLEYWQSLAGTPAGDGEYGIANLPGATYRSADETFTLVVSFGPRDISTATLAGDEYLAKITVSTQSYRD